MSKLEIFINNNELIGGMEEINGFPSPRRNTFKLRLKVYGSDDQGDDDVAKEVIKGQ